MLLSPPTTSKAPATIASPAPSPSSPLLDRRIEVTAAGLPYSYAKQLYSISKDNAATIIDYIAAMNSEVNLSDNYRKDVIELLFRFSKYNDNKPFKDLIRTNIIGFLETYRKTEAQDPMHKWIGTYNIFRIHLLRFFKWLYYPDIEPNKRPKPSMLDKYCSTAQKRKVNL